MSELDTWKYGSLPDIPFKFGKKNELTPKVPVEWKNKQGRSLKQIEEILAKKNYKKIQSDKKDNLDIYLE